MSPALMRRPLACLLLLMTAWARAGRTEAPGYDPSASAEEILDALLGVSLEPPKPSPWQSELHLRLGGGYARNVLYSAFAEQHSLFSSGEAEFFACRKDDSPHYVHAYGYASQRHYFELDRDNDEASAIAQGGWEYRGARWGALGARGHYFYVDQFLDTSVSDVDIDASRLTQHDLGLDAYAARELLRGLTARAGGAYKGVLLDDSDDDYQQLEGSASLTGLTPRGLSLALLYRYQRDDYDSRSKRTPTGAPLPAPPVDIQNHELRLEGAWFWDAGHAWRTRCWTAWRHRDDDGEGYYDYGSSQVGVDLRGQFGRWGANVGGSYTDMRYDARVSDLDDAASGRLWRHRWHAWVRVERRWLERWLVFAEADWEDSEANSEWDAYDHLSTMLGIGYVFTRGS